MTCAAVAASAAEVSPGVVRFALCRSNIQSAELIRAGSEWGFVVRIDRRAAKTLTAAARENSNATLEIVMGDYLLHRAPIHAGDHTTFTSLSGGLKAAKRDLELFRSNVYEGPCGIVADGEGDR